MRRRMWLAVVGGLAIAGGGLGVCTSTGENAQEACTNGAPEGSSPSAEGWSWWPPGTRCVLVERDGTRHEVVVAPWRGDAWSDLRDDG